MYSFAAKVWRLLSHPVALLLVNVAGIALAFGAENVWATVPFALTVVAVFASLLFLVTARLAFSIYSAWAAVALFTAVSAAKYKMKGFSLHFYDAVFVSSDPEIYRFLIGSFLPLVIAAGIGLFVTLGLVVATYRLDRRNAWRLRTRALLLALTAETLVVTFPAEAQNNRYFYYMQGRHLSAFFVSLLDLGKYVVEEDFEAQLETVGAQTGFADSVNCGGGKQPDVFVVLSESQADPATFPQVASGQGFLERYAPDVAPARQMSVETFGGGTWISTLSLMTGLSANDFGWRSPYLTLTLEDRIGGSMPELFARCGYRTAVLLPMNYSFVNEGPFLKSLGVETILDIEDIKAPFYHLRDDFYYRAAEEFIARHRREDGRPLFLQIQTMFPHSPYADKLEPGVTVPGEPFASDPGVNEYLRRMALARTDLQDFVAQRKAEPTARGSVILEFGDHQSFVTRPFADELAGAEAMSQPRSLPYQTFFTITAFGHELKRRQLPTEKLDIAFVGATFLEEANLPMSPMMADLARLRDVCRGEFHTCQDRKAVDLHLRRRQEAGMLRLGPAQDPKSQLVAER